MDDLYEDHRVLLRRVCPECKCEEAIYDPSTGEAICSKCGLVIETHHLSKIHKN